MRHLTEEIDLASGSESMRWESRRQASIRAHGCNVEREDLDELANPGGHQWHGGKARQEEHDDTQNVVERSKGLRHLIFQDLQLLAGC